MKDQRPNFQKYTYKYENVTSVLFKVPGGFKQQNIYFGIHSEQFYAIEVQILFDGKVDKYTRLKRVEERQARLADKFDSDIRFKLFRDKTDQQVFKEI